MESTVKMLRALKSLEDEFVKSFEVLDFKSSDSYYYLNKDLGTFPDHKHSPDLVESKEMCLDDVLAEIKAELKWSSKA